MNRKKYIFIFILLLIVSIVAGLFDYDPFWQRISRGRDWKLGLDLAGGSFLTYEIDLSQVSSKDQDSVISGLRDVIEKRVNLFGVSEPRVYTESVGDKKRLAVELAGISDINEAIKIIGETPFLDFREVIPEGTSSVSFLKTELNGRYVKGAQLGLDQISGLPVVDIEFNDQGGEIFAKLTEKNIGKPLAMFLDDEMIEMAVVKEKISGGRAQITGLKKDGARQLVERFNAGALPAKISLVNQQTINADFGKDALNKAIFAGALGTLLVMLFMIFYYRFLGIFAVIALLMYIALTLAIFKIVPITMTLAGIAGFILSIGMAVDANILVFERTKEELKKGLGRFSAVEEGFRRAWTSIRDSNISTLITSAVLFYFTSGFVKGFALALFIGVIVSMFSAISITRTLLRIFIKNK